MDWKYSKDILRRKYDISKLLYLFVPRLNFFLFFINLIRKKGKVIAYHVDQTANLSS